LVERRHRALLDYLSSSGLHSTFEALKAELPAQHDFQPDPKAKWAGLLEKKWTSVIRLQKKVLPPEQYRNKPLSSPILINQKKKQKTKTCIYYHY
jgi:platelet-activating factor acetylhydrolase IB subunit alpha